MEGIVLSRKESRRVYIVEKLLEGKLTAAEAAQHLGITRRQVLRLKERVAEEGIAGLAHRSRGESPHNRVPEKERELVAALARGDFAGASFVHMAEMLAERHGIRVSPKTVGRIVKAAGLDHAHERKSARRFRRRKRKEREGLLSQMDASLFDWLEGRGPWMTLHGAIDDATGKVQGLSFRPNEDLTGYFGVLRQVVTGYGVPLNVYSDRLSLFFSPKADKLSFEDELAGRKAEPTQFGMALEDLGIIHIPARTPQAKGRIERLWGTLQHRLVVEMRLAGISTIDEANAFLPGFMERFNARFAVPADDPEPAYRPAPNASELRHLLCWRHLRTACKGSTISFQGTTYHLVDAQGSSKLLPARAKVEVRVLLDGTTRARFGDRYYDLRPFERPTRQPQPAKVTAKVPAATSKPNSQHPWRKPAVVSRERRLAGARG